MLGVIDTLMNGKDLKTVLEVVYDKNAAVHMPDCNAVAKAFRSHLLVNKCLLPLFMESILNYSSDFTSLIIKLGICSRVS